MATNRRAVNSTVADATKEDDLEEQHRVVQQDDGDMQLVPLLDNDTHKGSHHQLEQPSDSSDLNNNNNATADTANTASTASPEDVQACFEFLSFAFLLYAFFCIITYVLHVSYQVFDVIYYPVGMGYMLVINSRFDLYPRFTSHRFVQWLDNKENQVISYLALLLFFYVINHDYMYYRYLTHIFEGSMFHIPWNVILVTSAVILMFVTSISIVVIASRKIFRMVRFVHRYRQVQRELMASSSSSSESVAPEIDYETKVKLSLNGIIIVLCTAIFFIGRHRFHVYDDDDGPPYAGFFHGMCEFLFGISTIAAIYSGIRWIRTTPNSLLILSNTIGSYTG